MEDNRPAGYSALYVSSRLRGSPEMEFRRSGVGERLLRASLGSSSSRRVGGVKGAPSLGVYSVPYCSGDGRQLEFGEEQP